MNQKNSYKAAFATVELVGALLPFFATNFAVVLIMRAMFGIGFGGVSFSSLYGLLKKYCITVFLLIAAIGLLGCAITRNIVVLCCLIFIGGLGFSLIQSSIMMVIGLVSNKKQISMASALMMSLFNLGMFFSSIFEKIVGSFTGDVLYAPLYIGSAIFAVIAVIISVKNPFPSRPLAGILLEAE